MDTAVAGGAATPLMLFGAKCAGAIGGSVISIAYLLPEGRREAALRFGIGLATGLVFGGPAGLLLVDHLRLGAGLGATETAVMGSAAASLSAWWALGVLGRFADGLFRVARREGRT